MSMSTAFLHFQKVEEMTYGGRLNALNLEKHRWIESVSRVLILRLRIIVLRYNHDKNDEKMQIVHFCSNAPVAQIAFRYLILK
jgi:hypothetical protein